MSEQLLLRFPLTVPPRPRIHGETASVGPWADGFMWAVYSGPPSPGAMPVASGWAWESGEAWAAVDERKEGRAAA